jgi:hypothetical protein
VTDDGEIAGATLVRSVTVADDCPTELIAVTVSVPDAGISDGAVYKPAEVTVPATAAQLVAPAAVNCCVFVNMTLTDAGEMTGGVAFVRSVTVADDCPTELIAVTVSVPEAGITDGAV